MRVYNDYIKEKFIPSLINYFGSKIKSTEGIDLGYELAMYDAFKGCPQHVQMLISLQYKKKVISLLKAEQFKI